MGLNNTKLGRILGMLPPNIFWALIISLVGGLVMYLIDFAMFYNGFVLTLIAFYLCVTLFVFGRQAYWFITKTGDYSNKKNKY